HSQPKRGVNSFMAFREVFYSRMFTSSQQKHLSSHIKLLWDNDPFHAKWSILARAYTGIRDCVGKENAPMATFLQIVCPKIGIIGVDDYFVMMNWVVENTNGLLVIRQFAAPEFSKFPDAIINTPMTERDVTCYCALKGYIS
ncbi:mating-type protein ALPHA1/MAT-1/A-1, partial [Amylocarpus encephaloides]